MAPKSKDATMEAFKRWLVNEPSEVEHSDDNQAQLSGSIEAMNIRPDPKAEVPQMRAANIQAAQTSVHDVRSSQSDEEGSDDGLSTVLHRWLIWV